MDQFYDYRLAMATVETLPPYPPPPFLALFPHQFPPSPYPLSLPTLSPYSPHPTTGRDASAREGPREAVLRDGRHVHWLLTAVLHVH
jgi:hypothetical protein